jgi:hypothetical protein
MTDHEFHWIEVDEQDMMIRCTRCDTCEHLSSWIEFVTQHSKCGEVNEV